MLSSDSENDANYIRLTVKVAALTKDTGRTVIVNVRPVPGCAVCIGFAVTSTGTGLVLLLKSRHLVRQLKKRAPLPLG
jgi:hypothetical protein